MVTALLSGMSSEGLLVDFYNWDRMGPLIFLPYIDRRFRPMNFFQFAHDLNIGSRWYNSDLESFRNEHLYNGVFLFNLLVMSFRLSPAYNEIFFFDQGISTSYDVLVMGPTRVRTVNDILQ